MKQSTATVAGIDVGGLRKGFQAVAIRDGKYFDKFESHRPSELLAWCQRHDVEVVAVDAPCHWSKTGRARPAELELMARGIWCFSTPTQDVAENHPRRHYEWMLNGAKLFQSMGSTYPLLDLSSGHRGLRGRLSFETYPHGVSCALAGTVVSAKAKRVLRRNLLRSAGIEVSGLPNIDYVDAALCALTAAMVVKSQFHFYGDFGTGWIVLPGRDRLGKHASEKAPVK